LVTEKNSPPFQDHLLTRSKEKSAPEQVSDGAENWLLFKKFDLPSEQFRKHILGSHTRMQRATNSEAERTRGTRGEY
jgi:hypothetical protein